MIEEIAFQTSCGVNEDDQGKERGKKMKNSSFFVMGSV